MNTTGEGRKVNASLCVRQLLSDLLHGVAKGNCWILIKFIRTLHNTVHQHQNMVLMKVSLDRLFLKNLNFCSTSGSWFTWSTSCCPHFKAPMKSGFIRPGQEGPPMPVIKGFWFNPNIFFSYNAQFYFKARQKVRGWKHAGAFLWGVFFFLSLLACVGSPSGLQLLPTYKRFAEYCRLIGDWVSCVYLYLYLRHTVCMQYVLWLATTKIE